METQTRPIDCPDCDSPIIWTGDHTGLCACSSAYPDDQASADREAFASRRLYGERYATPVHNETTPASGNAR